MYYQPVALSLAVGILSSGMMGLAQEADPGKAVTPAAVALKIKDVEMIQPVPGRDATNGLLIFDKKVPNGEAMLVVDVTPKYRARLSLWPVSHDERGKRVMLGEPTDRLYVQWSPINDGLSAEQLKGRSARFYSHDYPPELQSGKERRVGD